MSEAIEMEKKSQRKKDPPYIFSPTDVGHFFIGNITKEPLTIETNAVTNVNQPDDHNNEHERVFLNRRLSDLSHRKNSIQPVGKREYIQRLIRANSMKALSRSSCKLKKRNSYSPKCKFEEYSTPSPASSYLSMFLGSSHSSDVEEGDMVGDYVIGKMISRGAYSVCHEAIRNDGTGTTEKLAVKIVKADREAGFYSFEKEITLWKSLHHPNVLPLLEVIDTDLAKFAFVPLAEKGTLLSVLKAEKVFSVERAKFFLTQLVDAVFYLHEEAQVVHRDIKLDNILIDTHDHLYLADFGLSERIDSLEITEEGLTGSLHYCAPEQIRRLSQRVDDLHPSIFKKADIWAIGVVLYAMVSGSLPFADEFIPRLQLSIMNCEYKKLGICDDLDDLISNILIADPRQRLSIRQLKNQKWCK